MAVKLILCAISIIALSGMTELNGDKQPGSSQRLSTVWVIAGCLLGLVGIGVYLVSGDDAKMVFPWFIPWGRFSVAIDAIGVVFLLPVFIMAMLGSIYGLSYWKQAEHPKNSRKLQIFYGLFAASMAMIILARDGVLFLIIWEIMALSAYFLVTTEDEDPAVCRAGWVYLVATHVGTLCLIALFVLIRRTTGSFSLEPIANTLAPGMAKAIFWLALVGFGFKAGLMPLHLWLPGAHAKAPSHISAMMSGVMIKMGIYGFIRIIGFLPNPPTWWGGLLLALGAVTGILGIAFALGQHDIKRLLAYSSIENVGIIFMGLGLAMLGRSLERTDWIALGLGGALLHVLNHSLFKSLMFLGAGAVIHATRTRLIDGLGGLGKSMPLTGILFAVGAGAICALPPLNGFVSELFIYMGLFRTVGIGQGMSWPVAGFVVPVLAMIAALAVTCFIKLLSAVFLGQARSEQTLHAHDPDIRMIGPMIFLAVCCAVIGFAPWLGITLLDQAVAGWSRVGTMELEPLGRIVPLEWITVMGLAILALTGFGLLVLRRIYCHRIVDSAGTWDCGYVNPNVRMQYTGSSFSQMMVDLFSWIMRPSVHLPQPMGLFPKTKTFKSHVPDLVLDRIVLPVFGLASRFLPKYRTVSKGLIQIDILYIFLIIIVLFMWS